MAQEPGHPSNILVVAQKDLLPADCDIGCSVAFEFVKGPSPTGFCAWQTSASACVQVLESCEALSGGFAAQSLNALVAKKLMSGKYGALVVVGVYGCTLDLLRVSSQLHIPAYLSVDESAHQRILDIAPDLAEWTQAWVHSCLHKASGVHLGQVSQDTWASFTQVKSNMLPTMEALLDAAKASAATLSLQPFDYDTYELLSRDHSLLTAMQQPDANLFAGCQKVLDLGCGVGIFLDVLRRSGIEAVGVERSPGIVQYGQEMGLEIVETDAVEYIKHCTDQYDGIYCSHFVEHLPIELVQQLLEGMSRALTDGGVLVLAFPDPESIRSQLLGFWRDPEHVRFYHPELITNICAALGLELQWSSYDDQPHEVVPFSMSPPPLELPQPSRKYNLWQRLLRKLGIALASDLMYERSVQDQVNANMQQRTERLWAVNRTWAWNDNVILKLIKRP